VEKGRIRAALFRVIATAGFLSTAPRHGIAGTSGAPMRYCRQERSIRDRSKARL